MCLQVIAHLDPIHDSLGGKSSAHIGVAAQASICYGSPCWHWPHHYSMMHVCTQHVYSARQGSAPILGYGYQQSRASKLALRLSNSCTVIRCFAQGTVRNLCIKQEPKMQAR